MSCVSLAVCMFLVTTNRIAKVIYVANVRLYSTRADNQSWIVVKNITLSELTSMNLMINNNDIWKLLYNCSSLATDVWNSISSPNVSAGAINYTSNLAENIKSKFSTSYSTHSSISSKTNSSLAYYYNTSSIIYAASVFKEGNGSNSMSINNDITDLQIDNNYINSFY